MKSKYLELLLCYSEQSLQSGLFPDSGRSSGGRALHGWPDFPVQSSASPPPRLVVYEVATQHKVEWADASTTTGRPSLNARVQAGPPALTGQALLLGPEILNSIVAYAVDRPDFPPNRLVETMLLSSSEFAGVYRELLETVVATSCRAQQTLAQHDPSVSHRLQHSTVYPIPQVQTKR